jgi:hypothetical protein
MNKFRYELGSYDAVVVGGGFAGIAAARILAAEGWHIGLVETTGTLGREIVRARNLFIQLTPYIEELPTVKDFLNHLRQCRGWFDGIIDPSAASLAFDHMMSQHGVQVIFHAWPSSLLNEGNSVTGIVVGTKSGYASIRTPQVIDASFYGKLGRSCFNSEPIAKSVSLLNLTFNGVVGECPYERTLLLPEIGEMKVICRPTHWKNEWQVSLMLERTVTRTEWINLLAEWLPVIQDKLPELKRGVLSYVGDDVWNTPDTRISTNSKDEHIIGYLNNFDGEPLAIRNRMLSDPTFRKGLTLAGAWLEGFPFAPCSEEAVIINAIRLGEIAGRSLLQ